MKILFASSEIFPFAKTGGLGDVGSALPKALNQEKKIKTLSIMPLYRSIDRQKYAIEPLNYHFTKTLCGIVHPFELYHSKYDENIVFVYNETLCDREAFYGDKSGDYADNALRFGLFCYAIAEYLAREKFDILHLNDWQSGLAANIVKKIYGIEIKTVFTIHNLAYQGIFTKQTMTDLELNWDDFTFLGYEFYDAVNFLKAGIAFSDAVTTVSPTYAREIATAEHGYLLDYFINSNQDKIHGILNGIDVDYFNPAHDSSLSKPYDVTSMDKKESNKKALLKATGLKGEEKAIFSFVGRLVEQKGVDMLLRALVHLKDMNANFILLGSGETWLEETLSAMECENIYVKIGYDEDFSKHIYAGSDFLMMPSVYEPCGLNQMIALKYGTLPIVRETGGLKDSVVDFHD
ncbi:MAG: glycogen/starch synthase, partial [Sulfuricurvum sp.]|nr:glycogen/starch synthase [Sulfuricurvum sp.]